METVGKPALFAVFGGCGGDLCRTACWVLGEGHQPAHAYVALQRLIVQYSSRLPDIGCMIAEQVPVVRGFMARQVS